MVLEEGWSCWGLLADMETPQREEKGWSCWSLYWHGNSTKRRKRLVLLVSSLTWKLHKETKKAGLAEGSSLTWKLHEEKKKTGLAEGSSLTWKLHKEKNILFKKLTAGLLVGLTDMETRRVLTVSMVLLLLLGVTFRQGFHYINIALFTQPSVRLNDQSVCDTRARTCCLS